MKSNFLNDIHTRLYFSRLYSRLEAIDLIYLAGNSEQYIERFKAFFLELAAFPHINPHIATVYASELELFTQIETAISTNAASELHDRVQDVRLFIDKLYDAVFYNKSSSSRVGYARVAVLVVIFIMLLVVSYPRLKKAYHNETEEYNLYANEDTYKLKTREDIFELQKALNNYYRDNKSYPESSGGWDAINAIYGESKKDWIPALAPQYIKELPVDPRKLSDPVKQYMYKSDGKDYKLIAHFPVGMDDIIKNYPQYVDPRRPSWAFGVWTEQAKNW